jgi:hypothetical protein
MAAARRAGEQLPNAADPREAGEVVMQPRNFGWSDIWLCWIKLDASGEIIGAWTETYQPIPLHLVRFKSQKPQAEQQ